MTASLIDRLHRAAVATAEAERETAIRTSVRKFVRLTREVLIDLRRTAGGWRQVAEILRAEGLRWSNGKAVTAAQIRSLVSATKPKPEFQSTHDGYPKPIAAPSTTSVGTKRTPRANSTGQSNDRPGPRGLADLID